MNYDYDHLKPAYDRDGFLIVKGFLPPNELKEVQDNLDRYIREVVPTLEDSFAFYDDKSKPETLKQMQHMHVDQFFKEYSDNHPRWTALASAIVGEEATCDFPEWFNKPPKTNHPTPPHQDNYYFNLTPPNVMTIWVALDPVDEENGCLRYVPGSHLRGVRPHGRSNVLGFSQGITDYSQVDRDREVKAILQPGDATVHHGWTIHRAEPNTSQVRHRRSFALVFRGVSCQKDEVALQKYSESLKQQHAAMGLKT
jgi:phytanoyl-CoA hydroxylase